MVTPMVVLPVARKAVAGNVPPAERELYVVVASVERDHGHQSPR